MQALLKRKKVAKFNFKITILHLMKLPKSGVILYITWKRGKKHKGETKKAFAKDKTASWEEEIEFKGTLFKNSKGKYKKKFLELHLHQVGDKKKKSEIGHLSINLADYSSLQMESRSETRTFTVPMWGGSSNGELKIKIESNPRLKSDPNDLTTFTDNTTMTDATEDSEEDNQGGFRSKGFREYGEDDDDHFGEHDDEEIVENEDFDMEDDDNRFNREDDDVRSGGSNDQASDREDFNNSPPRGSSSRVTRSRDDLSDGLDDDMDEDFNSGDEELDEEPVAKKPEPKPLSGVSAFERRGVIGSRNKDRRRQNMSLTNELDSDAFLKNLEKTNESIQQRQKRKVIEEPVKTNTNNNNASDDENSMTGDDQSSSHNEELEKAKKELEKLEINRRVTEEKLAKAQKENNEKNLVFYLITDKLPEYSREIPVSAPLIYKALKHWDSFKPENNSLISKIITALTSVIRSNDTKFDTLCYWLSVMLSLLTLLQKDFPITHSHEQGVQVDLLKDLDLSSINVGSRGILDDVLPSKETTVGYIEMLEAVVKTVLELDKEKGIRTTSISLVASDNGNDDDNSFAFEGPVSQFKKDLLELIHKIFVILYQDVIRKLLPLLFEGLFGKNGQPSSNADANKIGKVLDETFKLFKNNFIPKTFREQFFGQVFYFINCFAFNAVYSHKRNYCNMSSGIMLKMSVSILELWAEERNFEFCTSKQFTQGVVITGIGMLFLRQTADVMITAKSSLVDKSSRQLVCPLLSDTQLKRALENYKKDDFDNVVPSSVLNNIHSDKSKPKYLLNGSLIFKPNLEYLSQNSSSLNIMNDAIFQNNIPAQLQDEEFDFLTK
ncbi:DIL domain-containing protein [Naegleria gruberi]|uniref:DIL domain-containing protein n=1 Tax=Naegleria gruberi TaxID=5762 RepID=D2V3K3_NAEGR|nr:DIL domain-containing protein [Naegleria gruberi]EFC48654.1 DIL domain-containing protein [Naegleria gruberi]|eukprot:XP_002681398.1 DIL domain-containing protein [Naegleria gruberi strain NEG-M]